MFLYGVHKKQVFQWEKGKLKRLLMENGHAENQPPPYYPSYLFKTLILNVILT